MKDKEEQLIDEINDLKKKLVQDKKNKGKQPKKEGKEFQADSKPAPVHFSKVLMAALPFLIIIAFVVGFFAGSSYEKNQTSPESISQDTATSQEGQQHNNPSNTPTQQQTQPNTAKECFDTDYGIEQYTKGQVFAGTALFEDACRNDTILVEYFCNPDNTSSNTNIQCDVCEEGKCIRFQTRDTGCKESDNYVDFTTKGYLIDKKGRIYEDSCSQNNLEEYYCDTYGFAGTRYKLCDLCQNGRCIEPGQERECTDSDGGIEIYTKGTILDAAGKQGIDRCNGRVLEEYYCTETGYLAKSFKLCNQCVEGACLAP